MVLISMVDTSEKTYFFCSISLDFASIDCYQFERWIYFVLRGSDGRCDLGPRVDEPVCPRLLVQQARTDVAILKTPSNSFYRRNDGPDR